MEPIHIHQSIALQGSAAWLAGAGACVLFVLALVLLSGLLASASLSQVQRFPEPPHEPMGFHK